MVVGITHQHRNAAAFGLVLAMFATFAIAHSREMSGQAPVEHWSMIADRLVPTGGPIDFTPHGTQPGLFSSLQNSDVCAACHAPTGGSPPTAMMFLPYSSWSGSMMANATRDPLFWAALDVANHDTSGVGDFCLRCHTPAGWYEGHVVKTAFNQPPPNDPVLGAAGCLINGSYDAADGSDSDFGGVTCHYCHRLLPQGPNGEPTYVENANAWVDNSFGDPPRSGPYSYGPDDLQPPHAWSYSAYQTQSEVCGLCHNVSTPDTSNGPLVTLKLNDGMDTGQPFPIQRTYSEWLQSSFSDSGGQTCQSCHMPVSEDPGATACNLSGYPNRTGNLPVHEFVGGNTWVPGIIKGEYNAGIIAEGGADRAAAFDQAVQWSRALLNTAATLDPVIQSYTPPTAGGAGSMQVQVVVTNLSGHKLPTGYAEGRRMWLNLKVNDANGGLVFESAAYDAADGVLTPDPQARIYEVLQGIWNQNGDGACDVEDDGGAAMFHSVLNDCIAKDNRIPPLGFQPASADDPDGYDVRPIPLGTYPETSPGSGILVNYDTANYSLAVPAGTIGPLTVTARLYNQTTSLDYMEFLRDEAAQNDFEAENLMCTGGPNRPYSTGPQGRTRGAFAYDLWNNPTASERVFANGFDANTIVNGYGKSPPELMQVVSIGTAR